MAKAESGNSSFSLRVGIALLTAVTAAIHFSLLFPNAAFILNSFGYVALLTALYAPVPGLASRKPLVRWVFVGYAALTVIIWLAIGERSVIAYVAKADELALIALLLVGRRAPADSR